MVMFGQLQVKGFQNDDGSIELELLKGDFSEGLPNCKEDFLSEAFDLFAEIVNELLDVEFLVLELGHFLIFSI
jgi:hypothetical protein